MKAAEEVYNTPELRQAVLEYVDGPTLAGMLRLEKSVTASVAAVLYKEVSRQLVNKMSRATARRATYCNAVKILDWSSSNPSLRISAFRNANPTTSVLFDPETFLRQLATWKKKYPHLRMVRYQFPDRNNDDRYVVHLGGERFVVELESRVDHHTSHGLSLEDDPCSFPATPTHTMMDIHHTFVLRISTFQFNIPDEWKCWLYSNPRMDRRITSAEHYAFRGTVQSELPLGEALTFLGLRQLRNCLPLTHFQISGNYDLNQLRKLVDALGPSIRSLFFTGSFYLTLYELQTAIDILDAAFPNLQSLHIQQSLDADVSIDSFRLSGLAALRQLTIFIPRAGLAKDDLARLVCELGRGDCVYIFQGESAKDMGIYHAVAKEHRDAAVSPGVTMGQASISQWLMFQRRGNQLA